MAYKITDKCISCGACAQQCPVGCIEQGDERYVIDPNQCIEIQGKKFYQHPGVGSLQPYNEMGNPAGGCFTMHTLA